MSNRVIAIDGPAGSGKSSVARALAAGLGWSFLDTGAMYRGGDRRGVGSRRRRPRPGRHGRASQRGTNDDTAARQGQRPRRRRRDSIREGQHRGVRRGSERARSSTDGGRQREFAAAQPLGTVVEGRDITTVVFPNATIKIFLTASLEERARRRDDEGEASVSRRDVADSTREASPLRQADDALVLDTTGRNVDDVVEEIIQCLKLKTLS